MYGSVWGVSHSYNDIGILNMSGLGDHSHDILEDCGDGHLPCALTEGILQKVLSSWLPNFIQVLLNTMLV